MEPEPGVATDIQTRARDEGCFRLRLQIIGEGEGAFGPGKAALLEAIVATRSISAAGRSLNISYRRCWLMVDEMNGAWSGPLVDTRRGGREQGARVTDLGLEILEAYRALETRLLAELRNGPEAAALERRLRGS